MKFKVRARTFYIMSARQRDVWWKSHSVVHDHNDRVVYVRGSQSRLRWKVPFDLQVEVVDKEPVEPLVPRRF